MRGNSTAKVLFILLGLALILRAFSHNKPISFGPYQSIECGFTRKNLIKESFIFNKKNGYLFYFDVDKDRFIPINGRINKERYFNSMEEFSSVIKKNKLKGNELRVTYINYHNKEISNISLVKKNINLRWLLMFSSYQNELGERKSRIDTCKWVNPKG